MKLILMVLKILRKSVAPFSGEIANVSRRMFSTGYNFFAVRFTIQVDGLSADGRHCNFARLLNTRSQANAGEDDQIVR